MPNQYTGYPPLADRFWAKVDRNGPIPESHPELGNCWLWIGGTTRGGYGTNGVKVNGVRTNYLAHRKAWELATDVPVPDGFEIAHTCDVRRCVRNDSEGVYEINGILRPRRGHLWLATHTENVGDTVNKGRAFNLGTWASENAEIVAERNRRRAQETPGYAARGEAAGPSKLTEEAVREIRRCLADGSMTGRELAQKFRVTPQTISFIRHRKTWAHVT